MRLCLLAVIHALTALLCFKGDDEASYAYDGKRMLKWHDGNAPYGKPNQWKAGEVCGTRMMTSYV